MPPEVVGGFPTEGHLGVRRPVAASGPPPSTFHFSISAFQYFSFLVQPHHHHRVYGDGCESKFPQEVILTRVLSCFFVPFGMETPCGLRPPRPQPIVFFPPVINFKGRTWSDSLGSIPACHVEISRRPVARCCRSALIEFPHLEPRSEGLIGSDSGGFWSLKLGSSLVLGCWYLELGPLPLRPPGNFFHCN